jgi:hypothetical protein
VKNIDATMAWPGFREAAARMGLHASLSIPLFAGSGATIAALNLQPRRRHHDPADGSGLTGLRRRPGVPF